jgi:hypothetical protein
MSTFEEHYTVGELAKIWRADRKTVSSRLQKYLHLIPDLNTKRRSRFGPIKRPYHMLRIPKSVAEKIYRDFFQSQ